MMQREFVFKKCQILYVDKNWFQTVTGNDLSDYFIAKC